MQTHLTSLFAYNTWANDIVFSGVRQLNDHQFNEPGCSGNGSIKETLKHMIVMQEVWLAWLDGSLAQMAEQSLTSLEAIEAYEQELLKDTGSMQGLEARSKSSDAHALQMLKDATPDQLEQNILLTGPNGFFKTFLFWQFLLHVATHGTHTRAQIISAMRRYNVSCKPTDYLYFMLGQP